MPQCTICAHSQRTKIDEAIIRERATLRNTAKRFAVGFSSVKRHKDKCLVKDIAAGVEHALAGKSLRNKSIVAKTSAREVMSQRALFEKVQELSDAAFEMMADARAAGDRQDALKALREARETLALLGKALGYIKDGSTVIHDNRRQQMAVFGQLSTDQLLAFISTNTDLSTRSHEGNGAEVRVLEGVFERTDAATSDSPNESPAAAK